jgi:transposase
VSTRKVNCRAAIALRMAASLCTTASLPWVTSTVAKAITAAAHKLARIIIHLVSTRQEFDDSLLAADQLRYQKRQAAKLRAKARALGFQLIPLEQAFLKSARRSGRGFLSAQRSKRS